MNALQKHMARHALGLPNIKNLTFRNHYCLAPGSDEHAEWEDLVSKGMAVKRDRVPVGVSDFFYLTLKGAKAALLPKEHISREDAATMREMEGA